MEKIDVTINSVMQALKNGKSVSGGGDFELLLKKLLTKRELKHIKFNYFRKGFLGLAVDSSSWLYQFNLKKKELLNKIQKEFGEVKEIRFRIGQIENERS